MADVCELHLAGWDTSRSAGAQRSEKAADSQRRAKALGAPN
jgi:hypothetical protein